MKHSFFRYHIKNKRGAFTILLGCIWDATRTDYQPLALTSYGARFPEGCHTFDSAHKAQEALNILKKIIANG